MAKTYATWNPSDKGANITLSSGNLHATNTVASWAAVRSTIGVSSGKWYWEVLYTADPSAAIFGVANGSATLTNYVGSDANGWGYYAPDGSKFNNGVNSGYGAAYVAGDTVGVALDMDAGTLIFYKNNTSQGTAFTGLTGTIYAAVSHMSSTASTANFGATALTYTPPSGYNAGLYTGSDTNGSFLAFM